MKKGIIVLVIYFLGQITVLSQVGSYTPFEMVVERLDRRYFIENKGQWPEDVFYLCRMGGLDVWITRYGMNYTFYRVEGDQLSERKIDKFFSKFDHNNELDERVLLGHRVLFELQGHNADPQLESKHRLDGYHNYFIGDDVSNHASYVGLYKEVLLKGVYEGIDIRYYFDGGFLRYDFIVHPYADPNQIRFKLKGQNSDDIEGDKLIYTTRFGEVELSDLRTYQGNVVVGSSFVEGDDGYGIWVDFYDKSKVLVIDPLVYSTYIGGSNEDRAHGIAIDGSGHAYVVGVTSSANYDVTPGAFQTVYGGSYDVFVTKLNTMDNNLVYSTYIGGSDLDWANDISVDANGYVYVVGVTWSTDFPIKPGAFQMTNGGYMDVFVTKLNLMGSGLEYSTYIGGNQNELGNGIAVDGNGHAYITGETNSPDYDVTAGAYQIINGGNYDVFVTKLNLMGSGLEYSTYIGGNQNECGNDIAVDGNGNAYITGLTNSTNYDIKAGAYQMVYGGGNRDAFVTKLHATGSSLVYSTYLGGSGDDYGSGIAVDGYMHTYVTGYTESIDFDITLGSFQTNLEGVDDIFVTKLNYTGTGLIYSTYLGGSDGDAGVDIAVDADRQAYVVGGTKSTDYDITSGAFQTVYGGGGVDVIVTKLNLTGSSLMYSTYIGGSDWDVGRDIAVDANGHAYIAGLTSSTDYDITPGAFHTIYGGGDFDAFVTKIKTIFAGIDDNHASIGFQIYPNPNNGIFTIQVDGEGVFELMDILGRVITTHKVVGERTIDMTLQRGVYLLRNLNSNEVQKLVIN